MSLLSGFVQGAASGVQQGWAELREDAQAKAKESMQMRLQDRAVGLAVTESDRVRKQSLDDYKDPNSLVSLQRKDAGKLSALDHQRKLEIEREKNKNKNRKLGLRKTVLGQDETGKDISFDIISTTGQIYDPVNRLLNPRLTLEDATKQVQAEVDNMDGVLTSKEEIEAKLGMSKKEYVKTKARQAHKQSTLAFELGIDPNRIITSFNQQPASQGGLLQQGASTNRASRVDKVKSVLQAGSSVPANENKPKAEVPDKKESEKSILDEFDLPAPKKQNSGGLLKALNDDPVAGFIGREAVRSKDAIVNLSGQAIDAIDDRLTRPNPLSEKGREKAELALSRFFGGKPTLKDARNILHSGLVSGRKKEAVAEWIRLAEE